MPTYNYKARDATGKQVKGLMEAASKEDLINKLQKLGYMTTQATKTASGVTVESVFDRLKRISSEDMIMFDIQLSNMLNAGISILSGLNTLSRQIENRRLKETIGGVVRSIEAGDSFSEALARHPRIFSKTFINIVKAGEASGKLDTVLSRFAEFTERQADLSQKIRGALFYPIILLFASIAVSLFVVTFVIPQFAEIFLKSGIALPLPTLILYKAGTMIKHFWYVGILLVIAAWLGLRYYVNTRGGRLNFDKFKLKMPVLGSLYRKKAISSFARTLATLTASGVPILQSINITRDVIENEVLGRVIGNVYGAVERGEKISEPLKISGEFPPDAVQMIAVGEETGNLDGLLNKVADFYDLSLGYTIKKLTTIIEPLFLVIMGSIIGLIMASMLLPMFDMIKTLRR